jgi:Spy/CpxP family protein refolding chaperone
MRDKMLRFILVLSLLLNASMLASAGYTHFKQSRYRNIPFDHGVPKPGQRAPGWILGDLSLKPEQLRAMQQKASVFHLDLETKGQEINQKRTGLVALIRADKPDGKAISAAVAEINRLQLEVQKAAVAHMIEFKGMLDNDQQKRFLGLIEEAMTKRGGLYCP